MSEQGYPIYFFDPRFHVNDVCSLKQVNDFMKMRIALAVAIILTQLLNPIAIPLIGELVSVRSRLSGLNKWKMLSFKGFLIAFFLLLLAVLVWSIYILLAIIIMNVKSSILDTYIYYIIAAIFVLVYNPLLLIISLRCILKSLPKSQSQKSNKLYVVATFIVESTLNLLSFYLFYIFLGLVAAPVATGFNLGFATTIFFLTNMCIVIMLLILCNQDTETTDEGSDSEQQRTNRNGYEEITEFLGEEHTCTCICTICTKVLMASTVILVWMAIISYCVFFYMIAVHVGPYTSTVSLLAFVISLFPVILSAIFPMFLDQLHASREVINSQTVSNSQV